MLTASRSPHCVRRPSTNVTSSRFLLSSSTVLQIVDLFRDVCVDVVIVRQSARGLSCRILEAVLHSQSVHTFQLLFPFPSDLSRSQERQRVLEQHHGVSQRLRGVSRRGKLVCLWSFDSTVCCCIGATMKTINKRDMQ